MKKCIGKIKVDLYGQAEDMGPVNMTISNQEDCLRKDNEVWFRQEDIPYMIEELKKHLIDEPQIESVTADWRDTTGLLESISESLVSHGLKIYDDPLLVGSDTYGFFVSNQELTTDQIQKHSDELWG